MSPDHNNENSYVIPTEHGSEMARLIDQDRTITRAMGGLFPPTLDLLEVRRVLDVACGPGGWARRVARELPDVEVVGVDISQNMIDYANAYVGVENLHRNARFLVRDVLQPLDFPYASFDLVNARGMIGFLPKEQWPRVVKELARITRPGGFVVLTESDDFGHTNGTAFERYQQLILQSVARAGLSQHPLGLNWGATAMLRHHLQNAQCQDIHVVSHVLDYSAGSRENRSIYENFRVSHKLIQPFIIKMGVASQEELDALYEQCFNEMLSEDFCAVWSFMTTWGVKR